MSEMKMDPETKKAFHAAQRRAIILVKTAERESREDPKHYLPRTHVLRTLLGSTLAEVEVLEACEQEIREPGGPTAARAGRVYQERSTCLMNIAVLTDTYREYVDKIFSGNEGR